MIDQLAASALKTPPGYINARLTSLSDGSSRIRQGLGNTLIRVDLPRACRVAPALLLPFLCA